MNILAIANNKGGVGKTTSTQNIGAAIGTFSNSRVLLVDLDPQANLSKSFGVYLEEGQPHVGTFLLGKSSLKDTIRTYKQSNIDVLPASIDLVDEEDNLKKHPLFPFNLIRALEKSKEEQQYNFVVIDCPPALGVLTTIALAACDRYYVPLQAEYFSYEGLRNFVNYAHKISAINPNIQLGGVFATRFNPKIKKNISRSLIQTAKEQLQEKFLETFVREDVALTEAQANREHIFDHDKESRGAQDYYNLTKEIILK